MPRNSLVLLFVFLSSAAWCDDEFDYLKRKGAKYSREVYDASKEWLNRPYEPNAPGRTGVGVDFGAPDVGMENRRRPAPGYAASASYTWGLDKRNDPADKRNWDRAQREAYAKAQEEEQKRLDDYREQQQKQLEQYREEERKREQAREDNERRNRDAEAIIERNRERADKVREAIDYNDRTGNVAMGIDRGDGIVPTDTPGRNPRYPKLNREQTGNSLDSSRFRP